MRLLRGAQPHLPAPEVHTVCGGEDYLVKRTSRHYLVQLKLPVVERRAVSGRRTLLDLLPTRFTLLEAQEVRRLHGMDDEGCRRMIGSWTFRGYVEADITPGIYLKTQKYLARGRTAQQPE